LYFPRAPAERRGSAWTLSVPGQRPSDYDDVFGNRVRRVLWRTSFQRASRSRRQVTASRCATRRSKLLQARVNIPWLGCRGRAHDSSLPLAAGAPRHEALRARRLRDEIRGLWCETTRTPRTRLLDLQMDSILAVRIPDRARTGLHTTAFDVYTQRRACARTSPSSHLHGAQPQNTGAHVAATSTPAIQAKNPTQSEEFDAGWRSTPEIRLGAVRPQERNAHADRAREGRGGEELRRRDAPRAGRFLSRGRDELSEVEGRWRRGEGGLLLRLR